MPDEIPLPLDAVPLIDHIVALHPDVQHKEGLLEALRSLTDEEALKQYFPDDRYPIARSLLAQGITLALQEGASNLGRRPTYETAVMEDDTRVLQTVQRIMQDLSGRSISPSTSRVFNKLIDAILTIRTENPEEHSIYNSPALASRLWHIDGRALTREGGKTLRADTEKIKDVGNTLLDYFNDRIRMADDPAVRLYLKGFNLHRYSHQLGWVPIMLLKDTPVLDVLTNEWQRAFRNFYESRGLQVPNVRFGHPWLLRATSPPLPYDLVLEDCKRLNFVRGNDDLLDGTYGYLLDTMLETSETPSVDQILEVFNQIKQEERLAFKERDWSHALPILENTTLFHLWIKALANADIDARSQALDGQMEHTSFADYDDEETFFLASDIYTRQKMNRESPEYIRARSLRDQLATAIYEAMMEEYDALSPEVQALIPFFAGQNDMFENALADLDM